jgi:hypothetical protein
VLGEARDVLATLYLDKHLTTVRERLLERAVAGAHIPPDALRAGEREAYAEMRQRFYTAQARAPLGADIAARNDEEDWAERTQKLAEYVIVSNHRLLASLPFVGQQAS